MAFSYESPGISSATRILRRARLGRQEEGTSRPPTVPLPNSSPIIPPDPDDCPALGTLLDPTGLPEPQQRLVLREHVAYEGCLEAWRGTLDQSTQVIAKLFLHEHIESAHREAVAYERFLSVPRVEGATVPHYWGTYTYRGEFYVIVLEDTGPKLRSFQDCKARQRYVAVTGTRSAPDLIFASFVLCFPPGWWVQESHHDARTKSAQIWPWLSGSVVALHAQRRWQHTRR
jgi:hypothetical protein